MDRCVSLLFVLFLRSFAVCKVNDQCRIERIKEYRSDGSPIYYDDEANQAFWNEKGFQVDDYDAWQKFKSGVSAEDAICANSGSNIKKPFCVSYNDPDDSYTFGGVKLYREKKICAACRPDYEELEQYSCDCDYNEFCTRQYIEWGARMASEPEEGDVRLVGSHRFCEGRVEIFHDEQWGTICDDSFYDGEAEVICRQLGFSDPKNESAAIPQAHHGEGVDQIWLDDLDCIGNETDIIQCITDPWGEHNCGHHEDAGVACGYCADDYKYYELLERSENGPSSIQLTQSIVDRVHSWTKEHGTCKRIPQDKIGTDCAQSFTGLIATSDDLDTFQAEKLWCGDLTGWEGYCYEGKCNECRELHSTDIDTSDSRCSSEKGPIRWCSEEGKFVDELPINDIQEQEVKTQNTDMILAAITMVLVVCILGVLCCGFYKKSKPTRYDRQLDVAEMTAQG